MIIDILHSFTNIFAGGRSEIKLILFLIYTTLLVVLFFFGRKKIQIKIRQKFILINLFINYLYGFLLYLYLIKINGIYLKDFFIIGNNGELSSTTLTHTHIAKAFLGQAFSFFGKTKLETMDGGGAFLGLIPNYLLSIGFILFLTLIIQIIIFFYENFTKAIGEKSTRQKIFLILGYSTITFSLVKTSIDGGIFSPAFIFSLLFIFLFYLREKGKDVKNYYYIVSILGVILSIFILYIQNDIYGSENILSSITTISLLLAILLYSTEKEIRYQFLIPLIVLFLTNWWIFSTLDREIYNYSNKTLEENQEIYFYNEKELEIKKTTLDEENKIKNIVKEMGRNITYMPITAPGITCMDMDLKKEITFNLFTEKSLDNITSNEKYVLIKKEESKKEGLWWNTKVKLLVHPCLPEPLSVINGTLIRNNISKYIIVNPKFNDSYNY